MNRQNILLRNYETMCSGTIQTGFVGEKKINVTKTCQHLSELCCFLISCNLLAPVTNVLIISDEGK